MIRLHPSNATNFDSLGIGGLNDCISCKVTEELNGAYETEMEYPITGKQFSNIKYRDIIYVNTTPEGNPQPFRIYGVTTPIDGIVTINAEHISYDLVNYPLNEFKANSAKDAFTKLKENIMMECPFVFSTNAIDEGSINVDEPRNVRSVLGSNIRRAYKGEFEFDKFSVIHHQNRGVNRGTTIRYGKNLTDVNQEANCSNVVTGVYPYWYQETGPEEGSGPTLVKLPEKIINLPGEYNFQKIAILNLSDKWSEPPTEAQLRKETEDYIKENNLSTPKISIDVSFIQLSQSEDYENFKSLDVVRIGDTLNVEFLKANISAQAKCIGTVFDAVANKFESISLGDAKSNIAHTISDGITGLKQDVANAYIKFDYEIGSIKIQMADIEYAIIDKADIKDLNATNAKIENLQADNAHIVEALIEKATITELNAVKADIIDLNATKASIEQLEATSGKIEVLESDTANIKNLIAGNLTGESGQLIHLTASNVVIDTAVIKDMIASKINVADLKAGTISTNKFKIASEDGGVEIVGSTQQFKDSTGKVRIQMGQDAKGDFNFGVFDQTGTGVLIDATGVKEKALGDGIIKERMIGDGEIGGKKIDIDSMITEVNNGNSTIKGSKVSLDTAGQTLEVAFNSLSTSVEAIKTLNVTSIDVEYYISTSRTTLSGGSWVTTVTGTIPSNKYLWTRNKTTYTDAPVKYSTPVCISGENGAQGSQGIQGIQGPQGQQGIAGTNGTNGQTSYFHIKYSPVQNPTSAQMTETPSTFIGTYVDFIQNDSTDPTKYTWARFEGLQGSKGDRGIPGVNGSDGRTTYLHIKYSNVANPTTAAQMNEVGGDYIGQYTDYVELDSTDPTKYTWSKIKGEQGVPGVQGPAGANGQTHYTWVKYADTPTTGMSDLPDGKKYIGFAYNKTTANESNNYGDYTWSLIQGPQGVTGATGQTYYTWLKYADTPTTGMSDSPNGKTYMGLAYNKTTSTESTNYSDYTWSLIKGSDGVSITKVEEQYAMNTSSTTAPTTGWSGKMPTWIDGNYIWTRSLITYSNGTTTTTTPTVDTSWTSLNDVVKTHSTQLNVQNGQIDTLIKDTVIVEGSNTVKLKDAYSSLKQTVNGINSTVSSHSSSITTITGNVSSAQNTANNALTNANNANTKIDGLDVGGRNLWQYQDTQDGFESSGAITSSSSQHKIMKTLVPLNGKTKLTCQMWNPNKVNNTSNTNRFAFYRADKSWISSVYSPKPTGVAYVTEIINVPSGAAYVRPAFILGNTAYDSSIKVKVEYGNKATDWSPAPEDVDSSITAVDNKTNALTTKVTTVENKQTSLEQNLNGFKTTVSSTYSTKNETSTVDGKVSSLTSRVSTAESGITQLNNQIKLKVEATEVNNIVNNKVDGIDVGGRNLVQGSKSTFSNPFSSFTGGTNTVVKCGTVLTDGLAVGDTVSIRMIYKYSNIVPKSGTTAMCWLQGSGNITQWTSGAFPSSNRYNLLGNGEIVITYPYKIVADHLKNAWWNTVIRHDNVQSGTIQFKMFKVEKGNKATDWSPAPEDIDSSITNVQSQVTTTSNKVATIETNLTSITQRVASTETTTSTLTGQVNTAQTSANNANTKIDGLQVGGRNIFINSGFTRGILGFSTYVASMTVVNDATARSGKILSFSPTGAGGVYQRNGGDNSKVIPFEKGKQLVVSGWFKCSSTAELRISLEGVKTLTVRPTAANTWTRFELMVTANGTASTITFYGNANNTYSIKEVKLEYGNKATDWIPSPEDVDSSINAVQSQVTTTTSKVATIETNLNSITQRVSSTESTTSTLTEKVNTAQTSANNANTKIDGLDVGGRNLITKSDILQNLCSMNGTYRCTRSVNDDASALAKKNISFTCTTAGTGFHLPLFTKNSDRIGKTFTWSFWAKCSVAKSGSVGHESGGQRSISLTTSWQKFTHTWKYTDATYHSFTFYLNFVVGEVLYIRDFKIEEGTKATNWTPAPEDVDSSIANVQSQVTTTTSKVATIEANVNSITQRVSSTETTVSSHNSQIGQVDGKITNAKNQAISTASGDATTKANNAVNSSRVYTDGQISNVNSSITTTNKKVSSIETSLNSITSRVSSTESTVSTINGKVTNQESRLSAAESKITPSSIKNTVEQQINANGSSVIAKKSDVTQSVNDVTFKFSQSGGANRIRNSSFNNYAGYHEHWWGHSYNNPTGYQMGVIRKADSVWAYPDISVNTTQIRLSNQTGKELGIAQRIDTTSGKTYTISFRYAAHRCSAARVIIRNEDGGWLHAVNFNPGSHSGGTDGSNWGTFSTTFTANHVNHVINIVLVDAQNDGYFWFAMPMINEGTVMLPWTVHKDELINGTTTIDGNGVKICYGALTVINSNGVTVIDGSKYMHRIIAFGNGSIVIPANQLSASANITHNCNYHMDYMVEWRTTDGRVWSDPYVEYDWSTMSPIVVGRAQMHENNLQIHVQRKNGHAMSSTITYYYRYFILDGTRM